MSTTTKKKAGSRRRRQPEEVRSAALIEARRLLLQRGPDAVTLKAVADELGMTHSNLLHHFGSAAELQSALMGAMVRDLNKALIAAVSNVEGATGPRDLVDRVFDAFDKGGAGRLAAWMALTNNVDHIGPVRDAVLDLVSGIEKNGPVDVTGAKERVHAVVLFIALLAFGDSIVGEQLTTTLKLRRGVARELTSALLAHLLAAGPNAPGPLDAPPKRGR
jgi:AcrR family transcriptional regulator